MITDITYLGDCLDIMPRVVESRSVDLILCDLPYGTTACKWDSILPFDKLWAEYERVIKDRGAIVLTASQPFTSALVSSNLKLFKYAMVWVKPQGVDPFMAKIRPLNNIEDVLVFSKGRTLYNPQKTEGRPYKVTRDKKPRIEETKASLMRETTTINKGDRLPTRTIYINQERGLHPTQKPVGLLEYLIKTYTNEGDLVLDNTCGSGSTGLAAKNLNRRYIMIEKELEYFETALERLGEI